MRDKFYRDIGTVDLKTGEILQGVPVYVQAKVKWREEFFMAIQEAFEALAKDKDLTGKPMSVLMYMFSKLGFENYIYLQQLEISEALGLHQPHVSRAIKLLLDKGIILLGPKLGRSRAYRLNSNYGWKGKIKNLAEERSKQFLEVVK